MNSGFRPIPKSTPFFQRCRIMAARGEAKSIEDAMRMFRRKRKAQPQPPPPPAGYRSPYADN